MKKVIIDDAIPYIKGVLEPWFEVEYMPGEKISPETLGDAEALIIRTRTKCRAALLNGSKVKFIATATIGTDHIDIPYCESHGIKAVNAPGCNSNGVMKYVFSALHTLADENGFSLQGKTLGIVGVGHVGSKIAAQGRLEGLRVLENDPPREVAEGITLTPLDTLLEESDIVTIHIPLEDNEGFAGEEFFSKIKPGAIFINASRGEVVNDRYLLQAREKLSHIVIDVFNHEPEISREVIAAADIVTPHIAGYTKQGKINGTKASVRAIGEFYNIDELKAFDIEFYEPPFEPGQYDIRQDDAALRAHPEDFEKLRKQYKLR